MLTLFSLMCSSPLWIKVTGGSGAMEPAALLSSLCFLETCGLQISHLVTDRLLFNINEHEIESLALWEEADYFWSYLFMYRSTTVKTLMKTQFPHINHQADPWHFVKVSHEKQYLEISCWMWNIESFRTSRKSFLPHPSWRPGALLDYGCEVWPTSSGGRWEAV